METSSMGPASLVFLQGGGEMGARMRALDWATTPLGPVEAWPQSLRSTVSMLLPSRAQIILFWGREFSVVYNDAYRPVFGAKHPSALGLPGREAWSEIWDRVLHELLAGVVRTGEAFWAKDLLFEIGRHGFLEETYFDVSYDPVRVESGEVGGVYCIVTETTERVVGERRMAMLKDLAGRNATGRTAHDACVLATEALAAKPQDIMFALAYLGDELQSSTPGAQQQLAEASRELVKELILSSPSPDARVGRLVIGLNPRRPYDDQYRAFLDLVADQLATALANARAYEQERRRADALAKLDRAKTTFFSNVSHEFRTPLTLLMGPLEDGLGDVATPLAPVHRERQKLAYRNALRLLRLVNTLLDFSRIEAGRIDARYELTDLAKLTAELAGVFRSAVEKAGLVLVVACDPLPDAVYVDREMWEKILLNLLSNALKFTFEGQITVELRGNGDRVQLRVEDTGVGIPQSDLPHIFERFYRVEHNRGRTHEGTGIGLALVQELARCHGGDVTVASREGRGTTFTVTVRTGTSHLPPERIGAARRASTGVGAIPYVEEALRWLPTAAASTASTASTASRQTPTPITDAFAAPVPPPEATASVLVADDNADMRDYLAGILGPHYRVEVVGDGGAALDRIRDRAPDLVLADVMMPTLDGFGLLTAIRADERSRAIPVILLSARAGEEARIGGLDAGADEYLVKPFSARELLATVASQVTLSRLRRETERVLRYRSEQYQTLLNQAPLGVYVVDADFRIRDVNPVALPVFGDIPGGVIGRDFDETMHRLWERDYADEVVGIVRHTLATGAPYVTAGRTERRLDRGVIECYERRLDRITLPDGRFGVVCYFRDISEQKQALDAKAYLAAIVDSAEDAIIAKDLDGIVQSCNASAQRMFGYTSDELVGRPVRMLIPPERQSEEDDILARLRSGKRVDHFETIRMTKDGRRLDVALTISPVLDAAGVTIGASKIIRDITAVKQLDAERLRLLQETAAVTETLNSVGAIVASDLDRDKVVQAVTDAATELTTAEFGAFFYDLANERGESYTLYTLSGAPREALSMFPMPRNTEVFAPTFNGTAVVRSDDITTDARYGHNAPYLGMPEGHLPVRSYLAVPVKGRWGDVIGGLFFGHSGIGRFSERHERLAVGVASWASVALENARMYASVQEASRIKDDFLAGLSHELRTPLNAILGYARMLRSGVVAPEKKDRAIETIERNATSLTQIVEDVLDISRIVSGKMRLDVQPVNLPEIVRSAVDAITPAADAKGVRVETVLESDAAPVSGDPERLQQVFWNLLSNAVKFTNRGGRVQVRLARFNSHLEVAVSDTGIGISPEFLPHVFERFRQADAGIARERGGLGLGLSIARQLMEMHGGTIDASSGGLDRGATFRVRIPLMIVHPIGEDAARVHPRSTAAARGIAGRDLRDVSVLAVDDEADALAMVCEVLEAAGARVRIARTAAEALRSLEAEVPDVVVADLGMPHVDGFQFIDRVRQHQNARIREVPAAALTAYARAEDRIKALRAGFQIHLAKPIDPAELVTTIAALARRFVGRPPDETSEPSVG
ncbi:MAG: ATP-binding protein [Acidobacteriota bacterium]